RHHLREARQTVSPRPDISHVVADDDRRRVIFTASTESAERTQQAIDLLFVAGDERPAWSGFELRAPRFQTLRRVSQRIDADGNEIHVLSNLLTELALHACKRGAERRTDRRAIRKDEVDCDCLAFDEV